MVCPPCVDTLESCERLSCSGTINVTISVKRLCERTCGLCTDLIVEECKEHMTQFVITCGALIGGFILVIAIMPIFTSWCERRHTRDEAPIITPIQESSL